MIVERATPRRDLLDVALRLLAGLALLLGVALLGALLLPAVTVAGRIGSLGSRVSSGVEDATAALERAAQDIADRLDPAHPPRGQRAVGRDWDEAEDYLSKGESFRLSRAYYKVNWVSAEQQELAVARYRNPDALIVPLKLELD